MFYPIEGGSIYEVPDNAFGFIYKCWRPPFGKGKNITTGAIEDTDTLSFSDAPEDNFWQRPTLPSDYYSRRKNERRAQAINPNYSDPYLQNIRRREWGRRLRGIWIKNFNPISKECEWHYLTGLQYLYITYWKFQGKFMDFRIEDMKLFYVADYCMEDPDCLGLNELTKRKNGKCFGKNTPIRMFDGTTKMVQDITNGEYVMGDDGTRRLVEGVVSGKEKLYRIDANKGNGFICNESHILALKWNGVEKPNYRGWKKGDCINMSVKDYLQLKQWEKDHLVMYRTGWGAHFTEVEHIIPSYMMGVYLGDGSNSSGAITTTDDEVLDFVKLFAEKLDLKLSVTERITYRIAQKGAIRDGKKTYLKEWKVNPYRAELKRLDVLGNKHIPAEYLIDSEANRLELLAGIIDTDGHLDKLHGRPRKFEVTQKNHALASDIAELARSLGFFANCKSKTATMRRGDGSVYKCIVRRVEIYGDIERIPCKINRKIADVVIRRKNSLNFGFSIQDIGEGDYFGFTVDKNNLFLLADGTVVHNTARVGCWAYERVSRMKHHHAGLQSKSDQDAEEAFRKAVIHPWQKLPDFFRPRYDLMKGDAPDELRLFATARRGSKVEEEDNNAEEPLESFFDFKPSSEAAYDGPELHTYISDEAGKTKKPVSIKERQNVVRFCTEIDGEMKGKHWQTTTVEVEKGEDENYEFQELTANSNPLERDGNNRTGTGLYTYFLPAQKGMYRNAEYAKYGYADEAESLRFINNTIAALEAKGDTRGVSSFKRKNPRSFKEAFSADGTNALYDPEKLSNQLEQISWGNAVTELGNLEWVDGYKIKRPVVKPDGKIEYAPSSVEWKPDPNGKYEKVIGWMPRQSNNVYEDYGVYKPNNRFLMAMGCDPFKYDKTKDKRRSNCAAFGYQIADPLFPTDYDDTFVIRYSRREDSTMASNEDVLKMAWWCGCEVLFERNVNHWKRDFENWGCAGFLTWLPGEVEPGIITNTDTIQTICNYTEAYINKFINKVFFKTLIRKVTGWLDFKVEDTEKFDEPMGAGITLVAVKGIAPPANGGNLRSLSDYFKRRKTA